MSLLNDFWLYCSCYEIPRNYAIGAALGLMGACCHRKIYIRQGDILHHGTVYITLVGEQGGKKSTAKKFAQKIFEAVYPNIPVGASVQSREDICKFMASEEGKFAFTNEKMELVEYHPYMLFINELENFLSFNMPGMLSFLVDIYDEDRYRASTIKRGLEDFPNPSVNILACVPPSWLIDKLKEAIVSGGFCRRMLFVYEIETPDNIILRPRPTISAEAKEALLRVTTHLESIRNITGEFQWEPEAQSFFDEWYILNRSEMPDNAMIRGYRRTKDIQLLKISMLLAMAEPNPKLVLTKDLLMMGLAILTQFEVNLPMLSMAAGRNELAIPQQGLLDTLSRNGGLMAKRDIIRASDKDFHPAERNVVLRNLEESGRIVTRDYVIDGRQMPTIFLAEKWFELEKEKEKQNKNGDHTK